MAYIVRIPEINGVYGERLVVNRDDQDICNFIRCISIWVCDYFKGSDGRRKVMYELPIGKTIYDNGLVEYAIKKLNIDVVEE